MKQLLFNLTRYACYLRRADMKKVLKAVIFFVFSNFFFFSSLSASRLVSTVSVGTCFRPRLCITVYSAALLSYFTVTRLNTSKLKNRFSLALTDNRSKAISETFCTITGTLASLIMEQGQRGVLTLYPKWLSVEDKLQVQTVNSVLPDSRRHLTAFKPN